MLLSVVAPFIVVAPVTSKVLVSVVAPFTPKVPAIAVLPEFASTVKLPELILKFPATCNEPPTVV